MADEEENGVGSLQDEAYKRRARLRAMREGAAASAVRRTNDDNDNNDNDNGDNDDDGKQTRHSSQATGGDRKRWRGEDNIDEADESSAMDDGSNDADTTLRFRNYTPNDAKLANAQIEHPDLPEPEKDVAEIAKADARIHDIDLVNLAPRKQNWDLKRDVTKKLEKLERRTNRAIAELIRDRLTAQGQIFSTTLPSTN
ncbi:hypothetical protein CAOG_00793 [Capsaspora owczarzaki ATCC 30864]|uniref:Coiled-coil domain-containing protein 12 n=1 Tax=Capsaspora owczarzaki (strain ATCC 30864) TaxID=595528 RepID=A0A0D2WJ61_CAPO3|nr:hypothetical protein CAOG_00793 [Capsaspora owczarzaki ATCC 30864]KJE89293.1 hypothetical protein CAOG_000793 [Capsaspora owczarzaki ATCC 30864]|eukprot:XP_004365664.1 hypothetical protein CAOG_00793 [Capsaspora owczarzaki ATCC 30864]